MVPPEASVIPAQEIQSISVPSDSSDSAPEKIDHLLLEDKRSIYHLVSILFYFYFFYKMGYKRHFSRFSRDITRDFYRNNFEKIFLSNFAQLIVTFAHLTMYTKLDRSRFLVITMSPCILSAVIYYRSTWSLIRHLDNYGRPICCYISYYRTAESRWH